MNWKKAFSKRASHPLDVPPATISELKLYLDYIHIQHCLLRPYFEVDSYPLVEARELLPSFETDVFEYKELPGFSLVAFNRPINYFQEIFQFDILHTPEDPCDNTQGMACPLEQTVNRQNLSVISQRLPRRNQESFDRIFQGVDVTDMEAYPKLLPFLLELERAHVLAKDEQDLFYLCGIFGSLPSDLDTEMKRFGLKIGKFAMNDNVVYERNRAFVYQFFMELYGLPIASERRTSCALFSRRLHRMDEDYLIRVLGQSDRTITTLYSHPQAKNYPRVEKLALVQVDANQDDAIAYLKENGFFIDSKRRVVIVRAHYQQHKFNMNNVRQERALSVSKQEIIHPITGECCAHLNIIKDTTNMFLNLNDIVRGEYSGRIVYKRNEIVENTDTNEKRLKFLYSWLSKHQRRIIAYTDEFYAKIAKVLESYLNNPDNAHIFEKHRDLYREVRSKYSYIHQARKVKRLEDLKTRKIKGKKINYLEMLSQAREMLHDYKFEISEYFDDLVDSAINLLQEILADRYIRRSFIEKPEDQLTSYGLDVRKNYRKLVALLDEFLAIRRSKNEAKSSRMLKAS